MAKVRQKFELAWPWRKAAALAIAIIGTVAIGSFIPSAEAQQRDNLGLRLPGAPVEPADKPTVVQRYENVGQEQNPFRGRKTKTQGGVHSVVVIALGYVAEADDAVDRFVNVLRNLEENRLRVVQAVMKQAG